MSLLNCACTMCVNNQNNLCCRPNITVDGSMSKKSTETFCNNFSCKSEGVMTNTVYINPNKSLSINCTAENCKYNNSKKCVKDNVVIDNNEAMNKEQTYCHSFTLS